MQALSIKRLSLWALGAGCGIIALAGSVALSPAFAGRTAITGSVTPDAVCHSVNPCAHWRNNGSGPAIRGLSAGGNGILGETTLNNKTLGFAGVSGVDLATPNPSGTPLNNAGVSGQSATGFGVFGQTSSGIGVRASANSGTAIAANAVGGDGLFGTTQSNIPGIASAGVFGEDVGNTSTASGVTGFSGTGIGVSGDNFERGKFLNSAFLGLTFASSINTFFPAKPPGGLFNSDVGEGVVAESSGSQAEALAAANFNGGPLIRAYAASAEMMDLDNGGNMILKGSLTQHGNPMSVISTSTASDVVMYSPSQAVASVEDVGEAQLVLGQAYVRLDPRFASTMAQARPYLVFITPQGDTAGLYVSQKTASGFTVREHGGQSSIAFDYRIVAEPYAAHGARLANPPRLITNAFTRSFVRRKADLIPDKGLEIRH
ncbi:MAG TPA: hypothetical protein VII69_00115 [Candidatus Eremiobacteraceae bacterium]